jgi:exosome complex exonuclease RRP6
VGVKDKSILACSIQISTVDKNYFIDCLELQSSVRECLGGVLQNSGIIKVMHGCDTDVKILYENYGIIISNVFDTAKFWCILHKTKNSPGLGRLSNEAFGLNIDKTFQCAEWRIRPLPPAMLSYAITDSYLMIPIFWHFNRHFAEGDLVDRPWLKSLTDLRWKSYVKSNGFLRTMKLCETYFN